MDEQRDTREPDPVLMAKLREIARRLLVARAHAEAALAAIGGRHDDSE